MKFRDAMADFLDEKEAQSSYLTRIFYRTALNNLLKNTGLSQLDEFTPTTVANWAVAIRDKAKATQSSYMVAIKVFGAWCVRRKLLAENPCSTLPYRKRVRKTVPTFFSRGELAKLFEQARASMYPARNVALLSVLLDTGIRAGELCNLLVRDVDFEGGTLTVDGKTGQRVVPLSKRAGAALRAYIRSRRIAPVHEQHLFTTRDGKPFRRDHLTLTVHRWGKAAGLEGPKLGPHTLRHTFAVMYIQAGGDAFSLQRILGHESMEMTRVYVNMNMQQLSQAHARFSPLANL